MCLKPEVVIGCRRGLVKPGAAIVDAQSAALVVVVVAGKPRWIQRCNDIYRSEMSAGRRCTTESSAEPS